MEGNYCWGITPTYSCIASVITQSQSQKSADLCGSGKTSLPRIIIKELFADGRVFGKYKLYVDLLGVLLR